MKIKIISILFHLSIIYGYSQNIKIDYHFHFAVNDENLQSQLIILNDSVSIYKIFELNDENSVKEVNDKGGMKIIYKKTVYLNRIIIKNIKKNLISYYRPDIYRQAKYIKITEKLNTILWELSNETKTILGYKCLKAYGEYKNKNYTVWYANEIPYSDGPWKFNGLPGLILQIESNDKNLSILAKKIVLNSKIKHLEPKVKFTQEYTWKEYVTKIKKFLERLEKFTISSSENNVDVNIQFEEPDLTIKIEKSY